ncbi:MAG: hypothetical protein GWN93_26990 [Deltaproteobacteria bacterium]|nr:hypothetical protein [Deltaproteobacteria bacterium]
MTDFDDTVEELSKVESISDLKMHLISNHLRLCQIEKRIDSHSADRKEESLRIFKSLDEMKTSLSSTKEEILKMINEARIENIRTESKQNLKIGALAGGVSAAVSWVTAWIKTSL